MVDDADLIICFVDKTMTNSGALKAVRYAKKQGKIVMNLFNTAKKTNK